MAVEHGRGSPTRRAGHEQQRASTPIQRHSGQYPVVNLMIKRPGSKLYERFGGGTAQDNANQLYNQLQRDAERTASPAPSLLEGFGDDGAVTREASGGPTVGTAVNFWNEIPTAKGKTGADENKRNKKNRVKSPGFFNRSKKPKQPDAPHKRASPSPFGSLSSQSSGWDLSGKSYGLQQGNSRTAYDEEEDDGYDDTHGPLLQRTAFVLTKAESWLMSMQRNNTRSSNRQRPLSPFGFGSDN